MHDGRKRFRKRPHQSPGDKTVLSSTLRQIGERIQKGDNAAGLAKANQALAGLTGPKQARVLALVADSEFKRGRFMEASQIQLQAASKSVDHATLWLRPHIGLVRALLKIPDVPQALNMARHAVALAQTKMAEFDNRVRLAHQELAANGVVAVPPVPPRVSVVATRMGYLFLQEGEPAAAEELFQKAIQSSKGGANRARQGLAQIALAKGELREAVQMAADAIRRGGYKAKTVPAWKTLIAARRQLDGWKISDRMIEALDAAPAGLRARTILTIVRELRKNDMRQWRAVAARWSAREGAQFPIVETEIRKMILSSAKAEPGNAADQREKAEHLLQMPGLSAKEWLTGAKELVRAGLEAGQPVDINQLMAGAENAYGPSLVPRVRHSLALSCMLAKRHDLARPLLQANIQQVPTTYALWGKSVWALAKMENQLGNSATAAGLYRQFFEENSIAPRFRLQAQLLWCQALISAGQPEALLEARALITATLGSVKDYEVVINFARQLQLGPGELPEWGQQLFAQGETLALQQFNHTTEPAAAMAVLAKLARRQVRDFGRYQEVVELWEGLDQKKRDWLWSDRSDFWEYLGQVFEAYARMDNLQKAEAFAWNFLDDPASPAEGLPPLGVPLAYRLMLAGRAAEGLDLFDHMARTAPTHPQCAEAWYWMALAAYKQGELCRVHEYAANIRVSQGPQVGMDDERKLAAKAVLLLADLDLEHVDLQVIHYTPDYLERQLKVIHADLERIPS